jgi:uncharacterized protein
LFLNYAVPSALVDAWLPAGTEHDLLSDGRAAVSLVGFRFLDTRMLGLPIPLHRNFDEVNLRLYVRRRTANGWRRGVVFVRELVPRPAIAWTARALYNEPYRAVKMAHDIALDSTGAGTLAYRWRQAGAWHEIGATLAGEGQAIDPDSDVGFITEHYAGYTRQRDGSTIEYLVDHPRWRWWSARSHHCHVDIGAVYGAAWAEVLHDPYLVFACDGAPVTVSAPRRLV